MKSNGQIGYEAFYENIRWFRPGVKNWLRLKAAKRDAWEAAADAIVTKVKSDYESQIEELEEQLKKQI